MHISTPFLRFAALAIVVLATPLAAARADSDPPVVRSIREWVKGDGTADDAAGVAKAFEACKNRAFTLKVDCPVLIHIGRDIARTVFVDNGTHVRFADQGLFIVDNLLIPAFVLANSSDIHFVGWRIQYIGGLPMDRKGGGYLVNGTAVGNGEPAGAFNDLMLTRWLKEHRGIAFGRGAARTAIWHGPSNMSALFYLIGLTSQVVVEDMKLFVPPDARGSRFIPMGFAMASGYNNNCVPPAPVSDASPAVLLPISIPRDLTFKNIVLDGYYMGFQGTAHDATYTNITGLRYGDLEDDNGGTIGGVGKWFAPPHLFYLNGGSKANPLEERTNNKNVTITSVRDVGPRIGKARDTDPEHRSGYACSLKIGGIDMRVTDYQSNRPDGLVDVLSCRNMTLSQVTGVYDSGFLYDLYPGVRFPSGDYYQNLTLRDVTLTDLAAHPYAKAPAKDKRPLPFTGARGQNNRNILFENVVVNVKSWTRPETQPEFGGTGHRTQVTFNVGKSAGAN
ncbi:MAG: hypothetical protein WCO56_08300 [Verrucomicrobiota bacterium]